VATARRFGWTEEEYHTASDEARVHRLVSGVVRGLVHQPPSAIMDALRARFNDSTAPIPPLGYSEALLATVPLASDMTHALRGDTTSEAHLRALEVATGTARTDGVLKQPEEPASARSLEQRVEAERSASAQSASGSPSLGQASIARSAGRSASAQPVDVALMRRYEFGPDELEKCVQAILGITVVQMVRSYAVGQMFERDYDLRNGEVGDSDPIWPRTGDIRSRSTFFLTPDLVKTEEGVGSQQ